LRQHLQYFNLDSIQSLTSVFLLVRKKYVSNNFKIIFSEIDTSFFSPPSPKLIKRIRHSARLLDSLPIDVQRLARDSYASSLKSVFILAASASLLAYLCRLPVSP
jgi:hypothetical protein